MFLKVQNALTISIHVWPVFVLLQILKKNIPCWFLSEKSLTLKCSIYSPCKQKKLEISPCLAAQYLTPFQSKKKKTTQTKTPFSRCDEKKTFSYRVFA